MCVPTVEVDSTSPSPANVPPAIFTVAPCRPRLSGSDTDTAPDSVTACPSVNETLDATFAKVGGSVHRRDRQCLARTPGRERPRPVVEHPAQHPRRVRPVIVRIVARRIERHLVQHALI